MKTIYQCYALGNDGKHLSAVHHERTEWKALVWLSQNGGGVYKNNLHNFKMTVKAGEFK